MYRKTYAFSGCSVELISDSPVRDSALFTDFANVAAEGERLSITVLHADLPQKRGALVYADKTSAYYTENGKGYYFTSYPTASGQKSLACRVTENGSVTLIIAPGQELWDSLVAFAVDYTGLLLLKGFATLHSACIEVNGKAILFAGEKQVGKSTQAALWSRYRGAGIINGDRIAVKPCENGLQAYGIPFCGSSKIARNVSLAVRAIVLPGKAAQPSVCRLYGAEAFKAVLGNLTYHAENPAELKAALAAAERIAEEVPVFRLLCAPDESSVAILEEQLCRI